MRDIFEAIFDQEPRDPVKAAQRAMRPPLRRRFYRQAAVREGESGFHLLLDGRPARTPAGRPLTAPTRALGEALATEWQTQPEVIKPARMPLTRLANSILDGVAARPAAVAAEVEKYLGSDLLFYRAGQPDGLVQRQKRHWDPVLAWARQELGAQFVLSTSLAYVVQPEPALRAARTLVQTDPWRLGAVHAATTLTGSALIALALARRQISIAEAWAAAHVDEDWNMEQWGRDEIALARRDFRFAEMGAAATVLDLTG